MEMTMAIGFLLVMLMIAFLGYQMGQISEREGKNNEKS